MRSVLEQRYPRLEYIVIDGASTDGSVEVIRRYARGLAHEVAQFFETHPRARVVYGDATWIDANGRPLRRKREHGFSRFVWMYDHNYIPQPSTF